MDKLLEVRNLSISIKDKIILRNVNLVINKGDFIFLTGNNGSGKSTFLNVLSRYNKADYAAGGSIIYYDGVQEEGYDILSCRDAQWYKRQFYYISQSLCFNEAVHKVFVLVMETIGKSISKNDVLSFLHEHNITDLLPEFKDKEQTLINKKMNHLSEGQKRIIEILAGIMRSECEEIKLLFVDEPFNHLDVRNISRVVELLRNLRKKNPRLALVITTHCQAFPKMEITQHLIMHSKQITPSTIEYHQGNCFSEKLLL